MSLLCTSLVAVFLITLYQVYRFIIRPLMLTQHYKKQGLSVTFSPLYGYLSQVASDLQSKGDILYSWKQKNYDSPKPRAFVSNFADKPLLALKDTDLIRQFFIHQEKYYIKAPAAIDIPKLILNNATILAEGDTWKQHRKLSGVLYSYDTLRDVLPEIVTVVDHRFEELKKKNLKNVNFMTEVQHILTEVVGKIFLGLELSTLQFKGQTVSSFVAEIIDRAGLESLHPVTLLFSTRAVKMGLLPRHKALVQDIADLRAFLLSAATAQLKTILEQRDKNIGITTKTPLLLELIYDQMKKMPEGQITAVDLVDEFANFAMGAMDTTSHAITYASYFILANPEIKKRLIEEVDATFSDLSKVNLESLNSMDYLTAIIKETLRLAAPLPYLLPRVAVEDHKLGDLDIKADTVVCIAAVTNHYDPDYHEEPEKFMPERWTNENSLTRRTLKDNAYVYLPFSTGARVCSGQQLGMNLTRVVLGLMMKKFDYSFSDKDYKMIHAAKFFSEPLHALMYDLVSKTA